MARVLLDNIAKTYPDKSGPGATAVRGITLEVHDREFMVLVGPSGCGKSTTLRMIAGLEEITSGTLRIGDRVVNNVPPKERDIAMVFQNYALYPHMSVYENLAFGLKLRKLPKPEIDARVRDAAQLLGLQDYLERKPRALSGGQRQRVAVGRAIVRQPQVFLFDEPLSNLDAKMRVTTRAEIAKLHAKLSATMIYVTHDQAEAMTLGDRICVMKDGRIMQVDEPLVIYNKPANLFVAGFIGSPPMNLLRGTLLQKGATAWFAQEGPAAQRIEFPLDARLAAIAGRKSSEAVVFGIRPENISPAGESGPAHAELTIEVVEPMGAETFLHFGLGGGTLIARVPPTQRYETGDRVKLAFDLPHAHLFDAATEVAL